MIINLLALYGLFCLYNLILKHFPQLAELHDELIDKTGLEALKKLKVNKLNGGSNTSGWDSL